jgi:hypothetical protein
MDRGALVTQMAKAFAGESVMDPTVPDDRLKHRADEALSRVEMFLGIDVEQAKEILTKVLEDVT